MNLNANGLGSGGGFLPGASSTGTPAAPKEQDQQPGQVANLASHAPPPGIGMAGQGMTSPQQQGAASYGQYAAGQSLGGAAPPRQGAAVYGQPQQLPFGGMMSNFQHAFAQAPWGQHGGLAAGGQPQQQGASPYGQPQQAPFQQQFAQSPWGGQQQAAQSFAPQQLAASYGQPRAQQGAANFGQAQQGQLQPGQALGGAPNIFSGYGGAGGQNDQRNQMAMNQQQAAFNGATSSAPVQW